MSKGQKSQLMEFPTAKAGAIGAKIKKEIK